MQANLRETGVEEQVKEHCRIVAAIAGKLADWLNKGGAGLDKDLILAGTLLHDVAYGESDQPVLGPGCWNLWGIR